MLRPTINVAKRVATLETVIITCANNTKTIYTGSKLLSGMMAAKSINIKDFEFKFKDGGFYTHKGRTIRQSANLSTSLIDDLTRILSGNYICIKGEENEV